MEKDFQNIRLVALDAFALIYAGRIIGITKVKNTRLSILALPAVKHLMQERNENTALTIAT